MCPEMKNPHNTNEWICSVCHSNDIHVFFEVLRVPVYCNVFCSNKEEALRVPRGDIQLGFCKHCGHISNLVFDPELVKYSQSYENSLHFSPRFQDYAEALARHLINEYGLYQKDIIEIGCGQGEFLALLCTLGHNRGVGFDLSYRYERPDRIPSNQIKIIQDFYSEAYADYRADLVCCRHVLEHLAKPVDLLRAARQVIGNRRATVVYFEVPNALFTLHDLAIWDIIYEHCSYFTGSSLAHLFAVCGFKVCELRETYEGQFLSIEALPMEDSMSTQLACSGDPKDLLHDVDVFAERYQHKKTTWLRYLEQIKAAGQRSVVWGAGSKGVTFLNILGIRDQIEYVVDINSRKQGRYVSGTGQRIVPPEFLRDYQPDVVLVMNPLYRQEIQKMIQSIGVNVDIMTA
jgi:SAM-dependent methyltransferase